MCLISLSHCARKLLVMYLPTSLRNKQKITPILVWSRRLSLFYLFLTWILQSHCWQQLLKCAGLHEKLYVIINLVLFCEPEEFTMYVCFIQETVVFKLTQLLWKTFILILENETTKLTKTSWKKPENSFLQPNMKTTWHRHREKRVYTNIFIHSKYLINK